MSRIFLSHSSKDSIEAIAVQTWLAEQGWDDVFLDLDPMRGIAAGERWERALHQAAMRCEAVIFLVSRNWLSSGWCRKEYELARSLSKQLFGVLIDTDLPLDGVPPELKGTWQIVDLRGGQDGVVFAVRPESSHEERHVVFGRDGLRRLKRGLDKAGLNPKFFAWPPEHEPDRAPYRGLKALEADDAGIFFGRDAPIVEAIDRLRGLGEAAAPRLFVILGASGAGKSSFLRAGLLPRLRRNDTHFLPLPVIRPGHAALTGDTGLLGALAGAFPGRSRADLRAAVKGGAATVRALIGYLMADAAGRHPEGHEPSRPPAVVLAIDQAEELFRDDGAGEGPELLALLRDLASSDDPAVILLFAIRSDAYDALERAKPLEGLPQVTLPLLPMPRSLYSEVINGPAQRAVEGGGRLVIEPQLTQHLLNDLDNGSGSDALPLLAFTLEQLFLEYGGAGLLRLADYRAFGGLNGAIDAAMERVFRRADGDVRIPRDRGAREALLRRGLIPWLAGIDPDTKAPRRNIARRADIPAESAPLIDLLVEERLLSVDTRYERDPTTHADMAVARIEPGHEALLRQWGLLDRWLTEDFGLLAALEGVKRAAREWDANARLGAWLAHQGQRLVEAQALDQRADIAARLDASDRAYLADCRARENAAFAEADRRRREREEEHARRERDAKRLARRTLIGLAVAVVLALAAAAFGLYAQREAEEARAQRETAIASALRAKRNLSGALAALSQVSLAKDPARAAKLALASWPRDGRDRTTPRLNAAFATLSDAVLDLRERRKFIGHDDIVESAVFSPDGTRVVTASDDKTARIWDVATGKTIEILRGHDAELAGAAFFPDGRRVATASRDKTARIWDAATGRELIALRGHEGELTGIAVSPDGTQVVTASGDKTARIWEVATGRQLAVLKGHDGEVSSVAFSPDGKRIVTASADATARIWDVATGQQLAILRGHDTWVESAAFSPDGARVVTASRDKTARIWDVATGSTVVILRGHDGEVSSAAFSPDGTRVATGSDDLTAVLWDATTGQQLAVLRGHDKVVESVAFSPDGKQVVTASDDRTARLWDARTGQQLAILRGHANWVETAAFSPDGKRVVTASDDETARTWDPATGQQLTTFRGHDGWVESAAFSPDSSWIVTASRDTTARIWDAATGQQIAILRGHDDAVMTAVFSPGGARVATASRDMTARIWDAATSQQLMVLRGHGGWVESVAYSPDGGRLVTASRDKTARIWDAATGREIVRLGGHQDAVLYAAFSADGTRVVTASEDQTARIWDAATGRQLVILRGHEKTVESAAFSPDGHQVVTASDDKTARIWDAATGQQLAILRGHGDPVMNATFSPDGTRVVTASEDMTARIWNVATISQGNLFQVACQWLPDTDLTDIALDYGLADLDPICRGDPPLPDPIQ